MSLLPDQPADSAAERALLDYFDELLCEAAPAAAPEPRLPPANVTALARAARAPRMAPRRPYAEPVATLNLRLPLPPLAPPVVVATAVQTPTSTPTTPAITPAQARVAAPVPAPASPQPPPPAPTPVAPPAAALPPAATPAAAAAAAADEPDELDEHAMAPPQPWQANGRPQWGQQPFESLLFKVGGLALAVPLVELGSIYLLEDDALTPIFGQAPWFMGLLPTKDYNVRVVDTARVVMPERYRDTMRADYRYVITLHGCDWGLAVDKVENAILLDPQQVRWRGLRSQRPWLAGTVVDHMCALLDASQLAWAFHNQDRRRRPRA